MGSLIFSPREWQKPIYLNNSRFKVLLCHRRAGKSYLAVMSLIIHAIQNKLPYPKYGYFAPEKGQGESIAYNYFKQFLIDVPGVIVRDSKKEIILSHNNAEIKIFGLSEPDRVRGQYFDFLIMDELGDIKPSAWSEVIYPCLADRNGKAILLGTPKGSDTLRYMYERACMDTTGEWAAFKVTVDQSNVFTPEQIENFKANMTASAFQQEFLCEFDADVSNKYYLELMTRAREQGRIGNFPYDPKFPVYVAYDLGRDGTAAIFLQKRPEKIVTIDYYEKANCTLNELLSVVLNKGYIYRTHILPHDANHKRINADYSIYDQFRNQGLKCHLLSRSEVAQGISLVQTVLNKVYFNSNTCSRLIEALSNYSAKVDRSTGLMTAQPLHDQFSHGSDAMRYALIGLNQIDKTFDENDPFRRGRPEQSLTIDFEPVY